MTTKLVGPVTVPTGAETLLTVTGPVLAPAGTTAFSFVDETKLTPGAAMPLNCTLAPGAKPMPLTVTERPGEPCLGPKPITDSVGVNLAFVVALPPGALTAILPAFAPLGTTASSLPGETTAKLAESLPIFTWLTPPSALPSIVTVLPVTPEDGVKLLIDGTLEPIAAVCAEAAGAPAPLALTAVSWTRIVAPASAPPTAYAEPVAPAIGAQP